VFLATGYTIHMFRQSRDFLNAAKQAGVHHVVHLGAPGGDDTPVEHWLWHQFIERYIEGLGFSFTHLRPDIFMQNILGYGGTRNTQHGVIRHYVGDTRITWIDGEDVAAMAAISLSDLSRCAGQTYRIGAEVKSFREIAETFGKVIGQPFKYEPRPPEEFLRNVIAAGAEPAYMQSVYENYVAYTSGATSGVETITESFEEVTGRTPTTIEGFATKHHSALSY
jgi:NAD(P)H dehydrogenase (quinone)